MCQRSHVGENRFYSIVYSKDRYGIPDTVDAHSTFDSYEIT